MIKLHVGDITKLQVDVIVNAANGIGVMGAGVAGAIRRAGGPSIGEEAKGICDENPKKEGECYITGAGFLEENGVKHIYHAVTMNYPGGRTSMESVKSAMRSVLVKAIANGMKSVAFPGLGTGIGRLDPLAVANTMLNTAERFSGDIDVWFADIDEQFVNEIKEGLERKGLYNDNDVEQSDFGTQQGMDAD